MFNKKKIKNLTKKNFNKFCKNHKDCSVCPFGNENLYFCKTLKYIIHNSTELKNLKLKYKKILNKKIRIK